MHHTTTCWHGRLAGNSARRYAHASKSTTTTTTTDRRNGREYIGRIYGHACVCASAESDLDCAIAAAARASCQNHASKSGGAIVSVCARALLFRGCLPRPCSITPPSLRDGTDCAGWRARAREGDWSDWSCCRSTVCAERLVVDTAATTTAIYAKQSLCQCRACNVADDANMTWTHQQRLCQEFGCCSPRGCPWARRTSRSVAACTHIRKIMSKRSGE